MQSIQLKVCDMSLFGNENMHFWIGELSNLLESFPQLEFPHLQDFYTIIFVQEAQGEVIVDHVKTRLDSSKVVIIKPRCISHIDINSQAKGKIVCFKEDFFSLRYNNNVLRQFSFFQRDSFQSLRLNREQSADLDRIMSMTSNEFNLQKRDSKNILRSYLNIILFEINRISGPVQFVSSKNANQDKIQLFEELIEKHYQTMKFPSDYANLLHISANYLNKICKKETGKTSGELIRNKILVEAQRLLHYTNYTINEIAINLGFETTSYFITFFKKELNLSPEQFRKEGNF